MRAAMGRSRPSPGRPDRGHFDKPASTRS
jgi:hypothetical protein